MNEIRLGALASHDDNNNNKKLSGLYLKTLEGDRIQVDFKTSDNITIAKYSRTYKFEYAQTIK